MSQVIAHKGEEEFVSPSHANMRLGKAVGVTPTEMVLGCDYLWVIH